MGIKQVAKNLVKHLVPTRMRFLIRKFLLQVHYRLFHISRKLRHKITLSEQIRMQDSERERWKNVLDEIAKSGQKEIYEESILKMEQELYALFPENVKTILELGCGVGRESDIDRFRKNKYNYVGLDIYLPSLHTIKDKGELSVCGAIEYLPFKKDSFDTVYARDTLEHSSNIKITLKEIKHVLKKEGILIFKVPIQWDDDPSHMIHLGMRAWERLISKRCGEIVKIKKLNYLNPKAIIGCVSITSKK